MAGNNLRILHVFKTYFPDTGGGLEQTIRQICLGTAQLGAKNTVATVTKKIPGAIQRDEALVIRFSETIDFASTPISFSMFKRFGSLVKTADLIHYHFPWPFADILYLFACKNRPSIITYHSDVVKFPLIKRIYNPLMNRFLSSIDKIVVTSPNYLESSVDLQPYREKCRVIPIGIDEGSYPIPRPDITGKWKSRLGGNFALFIGVLREYKGLEYLIRAAKGANYQIVIAGDGPMRGNLEYLTRSENITNIHFLGIINEDDKACLLDLCNTIVFPSHVRSEAFGVTLLEGAMYQKPLITTELGTGTSYVNRDGITGLVVPPANSSKLREALDYMMHNPDAAKKYGQAARDRYEREFTAVRMATSYYSLYNEVLTSYKNRHVI